MRRLCFLLLMIPGLAVGQSRPKPILERTISGNYNQEKVAVVLQRIGQQAGFSFSYPSNLIDGNETVTLAFTNQTVREVLNRMFNGHYQYKARENHLIISRAPPPPVKASTTVIVINGYVVDESTGEKVPDASVYDKKTMASAVTDQFGYYKIRLDKKEPEIKLSVSKREYRDTLVVITAAENLYLDIAIRALTTDSVILTASIQPDTTATEKGFELPYEGEANVQNIRDTLYQMVQVSFLPFLGTNGRLSGTVINDYSINFLGGYSRGTRQIELGFFFNIDRGDVRWLQIAGFGNLVGRHVSGVQTAGFFNVNGGGANAVQVAGFTNVNRQNSVGVQISGFANVDLARYSGVQVAGFSNVVLDTARGVQVAGFANVVTSQYQGSQFAGFSNIATRNISGSQISAFFNYGHTVRGTQIALFNYADTLGGVPFGLLSFVNKGYHKLELSADEVFYTNVAFRSGVRSFHNILHAGIRPESAFGEPTVWTFGYGIGTATRLARWLDLNVDLTAQHLNKGGFTNALSLLSKLHLGFDFRLARKFSIYAGGTVNAYLTDNSFTDYPELFTDIQPSFFYNETVGNGNNLKMWFGGKVALRFF
ncbi:MAG: STN and carboxypeptidase regulatory-like domain-containing protein [Cyclobacteriaceae bacterium]|jgi:hypothetical protein